MGTCSLDSFLNVLNILLFFIRIFYQMNKMYKLMVEWLFQGLISL